MVVRKRAAAAWRVTLFEEKNQADSVDLAPVHRSSGRIAKLRGFPDPGTERDKQREASQRWAVVRINP